MKPSPLIPAATTRGGSKRALLAWSLYDWANSSFSAVIQTFVFAAYFTRSLAPDETSGTALWGNAVGLAGLLIAVTAPFLGAFTDQRGRRKPLLAVFTSLAVAATAGLWFVQPSPDYLPLAMVLLGLSVLAFELSAVPYNAMLPDLAPPDAIGRWSGWGWALGYFGGLASLVLALLLFVGDNAWWPLPRQDATHVRATFLLVALWYGLFALPLFLLAPDRPASGLSRGEASRRAWAQVVHTVRSFRRFRPLLRFFVARMLYIDGLATLFAFGGIYAAGTFAMSEQEVLLFGIGLNVTGGLGCLAFALLDDRLGGKRTVLLALACLLVCTASVLLVQERAWFWGLGLTIGLFVGPVQAASRSYLARMAPPALRDEMFGLLTFSGKATAFLGPLLVGWLTLVSGSQRIGMAVLLLFFLAGFWLLWGVPDDRPGRLATQPATS